MIFDYVSVFPIAYGFFYVMHRRWVDLGCLVAADLVTKVLKWLTRGMPYFNRPSETARCDMLSCKAGSGPRPGFPSGHMSTTAYFALSSTPSLSQLEQVALVLLMGAARMRKGCHDLLQVVVGTLVGAAVFFAKSTIS